MTAATTQRENPERRTANDIHAPSSNTAATITYPSISRTTHIIEEIDFSYSGTPTGGLLTVADGSTTVWEIGLPASGAFFKRFNPPIKGTPEGAVTITLAAGGSGVSGIISCGHTTEIAPLYQAQATDFEIAQNSGYAAVI